MKVLFYSNQLLWGNHFDYILEVMQIHQNNGDQIVQLICNSDLKKCETNLGGDINKCFQCVSARISGTKLLDKEVRTIEIIPKVSKNNSWHYNNFDEIKDIKYKNFDVGYAVLSTLISEFRDTEFDIEQNRNLINELIQKSIDVYDLFLICLKKEKPQLAYVFNGRLFYSRAFLRACQENNIFVKIVERGCDTYHYTFYNNVLPHDIDNTTKLINEYWNNESVSVSQKYSLASKFYEQKRLNIDKSWYSFTKSQDYSNLPNQWDYNKINIVIYISSNDEMAAIGKEWEGTLFKNQLECLIFLKTYFETNNSHHFYVRMHPNLSGSNCKFIHDLELLESHNFFVISPNSPISSYRLLDNSDSVIVFGSTVGVEATYWSIPSILVGKSFYYNLDVSYIPKSQQELIYLLNLKLTPKSKLGALKYGYYFETFGEKFKYFQPTGILSGLFKGIDIKSIELVRKIKFVKKLYELTRLNLLPWVDFL